MDHYYRDNPSLSQYFYHEESTSESSTDTGMVEDNPLYSVTSPPGIYQTLYALLQKQVVYSFFNVITVCSCVDNTLPCVGWSL